MVDADDAAGRGRAAFFDGYGPSVDKRDVADCRASSDDAEEAAAAADVRRTFSDNRSGVGEVSVFYFPFVLVDYAGCGSVRRLDRAVVGDCQTGDFAGLLVRCADKQTLIAVFAYKAADTASAQDGAVIDEFAYQFANSGILPDDAAYILRSVGFYAAVVGGVGYRSAVLSRDAAEVRRSIAVSVQYERVALDVLDGASVDAGNAADELIAGDRTLVDKVVVARYRPGVRPRYAADARFAVYRGGEGVREVLQDSVGLVLSDHAADVCAIYRVYLARVAAALYRAAVASGEAARVASSGGDVRRIDGGGYRAALSVAPRDAADVVRAVYYAFVVKAEHRAFL